MWLVLCLSCCCCLLSLWLLPHFVHFVHFVHVVGVSQKQRTHEISPCPIYCTCSGHKGFLHHHVEMDGANEGGKIRNANARTSDGIDRHLGHGQQFDSKFAVRFCWVKMTCCPFQYSMFNKTTGFRFERHTHATMYSSFAVLLFFEYNVHRC